MRISNAQLSSIQSAHQKNWCLDLAVEISRSQRKHILLLDLSHEDLFDLCDTVYRRVSLYGISKRSHIHQICLISLAIGSWLEEDPRFPALQILKNKEISAARRIAHACIKAQKLTDQLWRNGNAKARILEMINSLENRNKNIFFDLSFRKEVVSTIDISGLTIEEADRAEILTPIIPIIGPMAMMDPVHAAFRRIIQSSRSPQDAHMLIISELKRRYEALQI